MACSRLGRTELTVSRLTLATAPLSGLPGPVVEDDVAALVHAAPDVGAVPYLVV